MNKKHDEMAQEIIVGWFAMGISHTDVLTADVASALRQVERETLAIAITAIRSLHALTPDSSENSRMRTRALEEAECAIRFLDVSTPAKLIDRDQSDGYVRVPMSLLDACKTKLQAYRANCECDPHCGITRKELINWIERVAQMAPPKSVDVSTPVELIDPWQPIETAPKDGTEILGWRGDAGVMLIRYLAPIDFLTDRELEKLDEESAETSDWFYADFVEGGRLEGREIPTHWMPQPTGPIKAAEKEE